MLEIFEQNDFEKRENSNELSNNFKTVRKRKPHFEAGTFTITDIKQAVKNPNRVNIFVNGKYRFSLDVFQLTQLEVKIGRIFSEDEILQLEQQSEFGKLYALALNYCLMRPHSEKEIRDYLWRKTLTRKLRNKKTGEFYEKRGVSEESVAQTLARLKEKNYIDDEKFARFWVENRNQRKGSSLRKLRAELSKKGVSSEIQEKIFAESSRNDAEEIQKIIAKKAKKYSDEQKLIAYLARQGFSFDEIQKALRRDDF
ncbi:MAG: regulatory protein RecX [bacterium]|nr:regulatory protein RecX [bacterium]